MAKALLLVVRLVQLGAAVLLRGKFGLDTPQCPRMGLGQRSPVAGATGGRGVENIRERGGNDGTTNRNGHNRKTEQDGKEQPTSRTTTRDGSVGIRSRTR